MEEAEIVFEMPENIKGRDLNVKITSTHLHVQLKGQEPILDNCEWYEQINAEDSIWTLDTTINGKILKLAIQKWENRSGWWDSVVKGGEKINTKDIQPESSKVSDIKDAEMRGTVNKMMFDMQQKQKGLPSSEELGKRGKIEDFMKAHPEMDFSKAKIC